jgi:hypothetical protein
MTKEDLEIVIDKIIHDRELYPMEIFWTQFCNKKDKITVRKIIEKRPISNMKSLYRLEEYRFIIKDGDSYKIAVPIFEMWLKRFMDRI